MDILYNAHLGTNSSWALVGRYTIRELVKLGHRVKASSSNGWANVPPEISKLSSISLNNPAFLGYTVPSRLPQIGAKTKFLIYNYESSILPSGWSSIINKHADMVLPASSYSAEVMARSGVSRDKIKVYPYGVDTSIFNVNQEKLFVPKDKFNFLYCAIPHARKGIDILFDTFLKTFSGRDDVRLILKTVRRNDKVKAPAFVINIRETLSVARAFAGVGDLPEIMILDGDYGPEELASLYNSAHAYVAPSRSEGFGMTVLEAMACGVPVIATAYSAHSDFLNNDNSFMVGVTERPAPATMQYWQFQRAAVIGEPNVEQLAAHMQHLYDIGGDDQSVIKAGLKTASDYTWAKSVKKLEKHMLGYFGTKQDARTVSSAVTPTRENAADVVKGRPATVSSTSNIPSRSDIRMRQANGSNRLIKRDVQSILQSQKVHPVPTQVHIKNSTVAAVNMPTVVVDNKKRTSAQSVSKSDIGPSRPGVIMFIGNTNDAIMSKVFFQAVDKRLPVSIYGVDKPEFVVDVPFAKCARNNFAQFLKKRARGMALVVDDAMDGLDSFLSQAESMRSGDSVFCVVASLDSAAVCSKHGGVIILYDGSASTTKAGTILSVAPKSISCDMSVAQNNIFDNTIIHGEVVI